MQARELQRQSRVNFSRYPSLLARNGYYESFFIRGNSPCGNEAFWLRYTQTKQKGSDEPFAELWAVFFDGDRIYSDKKVIPASSYSFPKRYFQVELVDSFINDGVAKGEAIVSIGRLLFGGGLSPVYLLPQTMYSTPFPKSKSITRLTRWLPSTVKLPLAL